MTILYNFLMEKTEEDYTASQKDQFWVALTYMTGHITYGGNVTDEGDRVLLLSLLGKFYNENVI